VTTRPDMEKERPDIYNSELIGETSSLGNMCLETVGNSVRTHSGFCHVARIQRPLGHRWPVLG